MQTFDTARLRLRPLTQGDEALYCRLYTDPEVMRFIATPLSLAAAGTHFRAALEQQGDKRLLWIITLLGSDVEVGLLGATSSAEQVAEVGVMLFAEGQANGIAAEALGAVHGPLFQQYGFQRIWTRHARLNGHARALMSKLGYVPLAGSHDVETQLRWEITESLWRARRHVAITAAAR